MRAMREVDLAELLGVPREVVRRVRRDAERGFREGSDWEALETGVTFTDVGVARMLEQPEFRKISSESELVSEAAGGFGDAGPGPGKPEVVMVRITCIWRGNTKRMEIEHDGELGVLQVRSTENFMRGMEVPAVQEPGKRLFHFRGRYPRRRGKL